MSEQEIKAGESVQEETKESAAGPQTVAAENAPGVTKEDLEVVKLVKQQLAAVLEASRCTLVPITTIVNGKVYQAVEVVRRPEKQVLSQVPGGGRIIRP